jgi:carboxyl-terminal processing protease
MKRRMQPSVLGAAAILALVVVAPSLSAEGPSLTPQQLRARAAECEQRGQWTRACACYNQLLKGDRTSPELREHFQNCLRHAAQLRRHRDPDFVKSIRGRGLPEALDIYEEVLRRLQVNYVERDRINLTALVRHGLEELRFALEDPAFVRENLAGVKPDRVRAFAERVERWDVPEVSKVHDAAEQVRLVALAGVEQVGLKPSAAVMEFAWGAANSLDDYTVLLTPSQFSFLQAALRGEIVGVGLKLTTQDERLVILGVLPNSPAAEKGLKANDQITRIDGESADGWSEDAAAARLMGKTGTPVDLEVLTPDMGPRNVRLVRQAVLSPSVDGEMLRDGVGYVRILTFQETTLQELKDALLELQTNQMKALVLDLRGNSGGTFETAVQVAELFLPSGVIVVTESPLRRFNRTYRAHNPHALTLPLVVLIDGDTASAAEVLAGALKENQRATLIGSPTYGKGSIQCPVALRKMPAGLWITVARFYSPTNQSYNGRGVTPNEREDVDVVQRTRAWSVAHDLIMMAHNP